MGMRGDFHEIFREHYKFNSRVADKQDCFLCHGEIEEKWKKLVYAEDKETWGRDRSNRVDVNLAQRNDQEVIVTYHLKCWEKIVFDPHEY